MFEPMRYFKKEILREISLPKREPIQDSTPKETVRKHPISAGKPELPDECCEALTRKTLWERVNP
jgi:hypothetical protein